MVTVTRLRGLKHASPTCSQGHVWGGLIPAQCVTVKEIGELLATEYLVQCLKVKEIGKLLANEYLAQCLNVKEIGELLAIDYPNE